MLLSLLLIASAATPITLEDALRAALVQSPDLREARRAVDAAGVAVTAAHSAFSPTLSAGTDWSGSENQSFLAGYPTSSSATTWQSRASVGGALGWGTSWSVSADLQNQQTETVSTLGGLESAQATDTWSTTLGVSVQQDLLALLRPTDARVALRQAVERADQQTVVSLAARQATLSAVAVAWWSWTTAIAQAEVASRAVTAADALEALTAAWVEEGKVDRVELARVQADRLSAELSAVEASASASAAADALLLVIGGEVGADVVPAGSGAPTPLEAASLTDHLALAEASSPTLALARLQVEAARRARQDVRYAGLPALSLSASTGLSTWEASAADAVSQLATDAALPTWAAGVELSLPLGRAAQASRESASLNIVQYEIALADTTQSLRAELAGALRDVASAEQRLGLTTARLEVARQTEAGEQARIAEGTRRFDQLLDAINAREDAEVEVLSARLALWQATIEVARLEGRVEAMLIP